jgi:hypothetical protein
VARVSNTTIDKPIDVQALRDLVAKKILERRRH